MVSNESWGEVLRYADSPTLDPALTRASPMIELGGTGLKRASGIIDEEFLPALRGRKAVRVYREMADNSPIVGSLLFSIEKLLRQVEWRVVAPDNTPEMSQAVEFVEQCMEDMSHTWDDMIAEILSMLTYGWSWHEIVYKRRIGPWEKDPRKQSKYTDGKIGWRKIPIRSQETLLRWIFDEEGGVKALVQIPPPYYQTKIIPVERSLLFRTGIYKGNPEGRSLLRTAYRPWFFLKRLEEFEAIGVERDLAGLPVARVPSSYMNAAQGSKESQVYQAFKKMVQNVRRDEHDGLVLPLEYDPDTKQPLFEFELMSSGGARQFDTSALIQRYEQRILMSCLADFILLGHEEVGSYALHVDKTGIFRTALNTIAKAIANVFNKHAIPRLFQINGWKLDQLPQIEPANVDPPDLTQLAQFMTAMAQIGMNWFPDPELEKFLREVAHLPEIPDDMLEMRRQQAQMQHSMDFYTTAQQATMVDQGYSPQQAQQAQEAPHPDMVDQQSGLMQQQAQNEMQAQQGEVQLDQQGRQTKMQLDAKEKEAQINERSAAAEHKRQLMLEKLKQKSADQQFKGKERLTNVGVAAHKEKAKVNAQAEKNRPVPKKTAAKKPLPKPKRG